MAVSALELRPRGPVALFDAAIRLCSRSSGVWALTLPGGAVVTAAALHLFDAVEHHRDLLVPCALFTAAWFARGLFQGAACHFLEQQLLGAAEPTTTGSLKAALGRLPSLTIAVAYLATLAIFGPLLTLGLYYLLLGSSVVGYAVTMQGKGHPLSLYGTCSKTLGAARNAAVWVRLLFSVQVLVVLNIHIAANVAVYLGEKLLALDLTFADRFVSIDNGAWVTAAIALGFTLFEPLRAAAATLLLIDGRVRQEGLDLVAAIEQLPARHQKKAPRAAAALPLLLLAATLASAPAQAAEARRPATAGEAKGRLSEVMGRCNLTGPTQRKQLDAVDGLSGKEQAALSRFLEDVEADAYDGDCDAAAARLKQGLPLIVQTRDSLAGQQGPAGARERAARILARPEFTPDPEQVKVEKPDEPEAPQAPPSWWTRFKDWLARLSDDFWAWLKRLFDSRDDRTDPKLDLPSPGGGAALANVLVVVLVVAVVAVLVAVLLKARRRGDGDDADLQIETLAEGPLSTDPMSALSRPPDAWAALADELAARGDFREAVRSLYLALLSRLHRVGAIDYDPARSNWDYFRGFKGKREWVPPFRELTNRFDFTYYGNLGASLDGYRHFRSLTHPLLVEPVADSASEASRA